LTGFAHTVNGSSLAVPTSLCAIRVSKKNLMPNPNCRERVEDALARIADPLGEGPRACLTVYAEEARASADAADARAKAHRLRGPLDGVIVSVKDLFDIAGEPTRAGSKVLAAIAGPARTDAPVIQRLRAAGAVIIAKTNMTEFAFSGIGLNPHFGTPRNPADRRRIPGGSSSGGAVAVADSFCEIAIGTDTGGSTRIPAALCGIVGYKPSKQRIPTEGAFPLSFTLDSVGPMARTVAQCAAADAVMAGEEPKTVEPVALAGLPLGIAQGAPLDSLDTHVGAAFEWAVTLLNKAGAALSDQKISLIDEMADLTGRGGLIAPEALSIHRDLLAAHGNDVDPNVRVRIERARQISAADYIATLRAREKLVSAMDRRLEGLDALLMPTVQIVAPHFDDVSTPETFAARNAQVLRNTTIANFFSLCAVSLPIPDSSFPVGLMLVGRNGDDRRLFRIAAAIEGLMTSH
jgi:aspartyl-tRNA(Asn)/glutamyl-tRNA(Gln) amidotransferase subunit A